MWMLCLAVNASTSATTTELRSTASATDWVDSQTTNAADQQLALYL